MTKVDIWNKALAMLPHDRRVMAENDGSTEALRCADAWDDARLAVIAAANWGFLTVAMPVCNGVPCDGRGFRYPRPDDAVRVIGLYNRRGRKQRAVAVQGAFYSPCPAGSIRYIPDSKDYDDWPAWFLDAVVAELASRIAGTITGSMQQASLLQQTAQLKLATARDRDAREIRHDGLDPDYIAHVRNREYWGEPFHAHHIE